MTEGLPRPVSLPEPCLLKLPDEGEGYSDEAPYIWAWFAHGYDTGMTPYFSDDQMNAYADQCCAAVVSERDALAVRVRELEGALREVEVFMSDLLRESLEAEGFTGQQLDRMVVMAKAPHITKPDSPLGKVIAALTTTSGDSHEPQN